MAQTIWLVIGWKTDAEHLRQDDQPERRELREAERARRARLRLGHGAEAAAEGLGEIARIVEGDADEQRDKAVEPDAELAEAEIGHVDLEERRRVARDLDPGDGDGVEDAVAASAASRRARCRGRCR